MGSSLAGDISRGADGPDPKIEVVDKGEANALGRRGLNIGSGSFCVRIFDV